ncbi:hypothetical protein, partial [Vibrio vulnificus]|uniref:hypothetical protein n=1 Tax=Vibrio vulnificus TaxID=672 RepID=UPI0009B70E19
LELYFLKVLCLLLTSHCPSHNIAAVLVSSETGNEISRGKTLLFPLVMPDLPIHTSRRGIGLFYLLLGYPSCTGLLSGFCSSQPSFAVCFL